MRNYSVTDKSENKAITDAIQNFKIFKGLYMSLYNTVGDNLLGYLYNCPILEQEIFDEDLRLNDFEISYVFKTVIMVKNYLVSVFVFDTYIERDLVKFLVI